MGRPALSASRCLEVLDLLTAHPDRSFTLAEIRRAINVSPASCYAVVSELARRGYVLKNPTRKTYALGLVPIAVGQSALTSQPLAARAREAAEQLCRELDVPVVLNTIAGDQIVTIFSMADGSGRGGSLRVGERLPLMPPMGAPFFAWSTPDAVEKWLGRLISSHGPEMVDEARRSLTVIRERGYQLTLLLLKTVEFSALMAQMASGAEGSVRTDQIGVFDTLNRQLSQPDEIGDDTDYEVASIAAPIFDGSGTAVFAVGLGPFGARIKGSDIKHHADRLVSTCVQVMQASRKRV